MASCSRFVVPELPPTPHQPSTGFVFPRRAFGIKNVVWRSFQRIWLNQRYSEVLPQSYIINSNLLKKIYDFLWGGMPPDPLPHPGSYVGKARIIMTFPFHVADDTESRNQ